MNDFELLQLFQNFGIFYIFHFNYSKTIFKILYYNNVKNLINLFI